MMFEDLHVNSEEELGFSSQLFSDSLGFDLLGDVNQDYEELTPQITNESANEHLQNGKNNILTEIVMDLQIPMQQEPEEEELKTAGIGVTEDPFFAETTKAANLFQPKKVEKNPFFAETTKAAKEDSTQSLIEEMEEFLNQVENKEEEEEKVKQDSSISEEEAQKLLNQLMTGDCMMDDSESGFDDSSVNSVTHLVNDKGENIIILIANDDQNVPGSAGSSVMGSPKPGCTDDSDDSDWSPNFETQAGRRSKRSNAGRNSKYDKFLNKKDDFAASKVTKRGRKSLTPNCSFENVKDKKERKKLQNVVAARRYRDKKKNEMTEAEMEEEKLQVKNQSLRSKLSEMEGEMKILKKLALELGLV